MAESNRTASRCSSPASSRLTADGSSRISARPEITTRIRRGWASNAWIITSSDDTADGPRRWTCSKVSSTTRIRDLVRESRLAITGSQSSASALLRRDELSVRYAAVSATSPATVRNRSRAA